MKDYEHVVIWLDYFNKTLPKNKGRKLAKEKCVFDPSLNELIDAVKDAGFGIKESDDKVRFPRRPYVRSGYVVLPKGSPKTKKLDKIAKVTELIGPVAKPYASAIPLTNNVKKYIGKKIFLLASTPANYKKFRRNR